VRLSRLHVLDAVPTEALWAMEQALRAGCCGAVLGWPLRAEARALRRLQVAAETGQTPGFLFQAPEAAHNPSPAPLRLQLEHVPAGLALRILKCRGRPPPAAAILLVADQQDGAPERAGSPRFPARPPAPARDPVTGKHALALLSPPFSSGTQRLSPRSRDSGRGGA
jgi:hypothetical protein